MKVTPVKESETKGSRQTKLSFPRAGNGNNSPPTPSGTMALKVITPDNHAGTNRIRHPSPPSNPKSPQTTRKHTPKNNTDNTTTKATTTKTSPPKNNTVTSNDDNNNKKPAAKTSNTTTLTDATILTDEFKEPVTTTNREQFTLIKKPPRRKKEVTTELTPPKLVKKDKPDTPIPPNPEKSPANQEPSTLSQNCGSI
jgi:hypothetical protein